MSERSFHPQFEAQEQPKESPPELNLADSTKLDIFGVEVEGRKKRTPEEIQELKEKIGLIYKVFSRNYETKVVPSPTGGWACGLDPKAMDSIDRFMRGEITSLDDLPDELFKPNQFLYDLNDLAIMPEDEAIGVTRHEVGHSNNTDYRLFIKGQRVAQEEGYLPTSWAWVANALEDPWINNIEIGGSETVREKMTKLYAARFPEIVEKINTQPVTRQLGLNLNYYWITGQSIPTIKDPKVLKVFEKIKPYADQFFVGPNAKENYDNLLNNIWPEYRTLEEKATADEKLKELARQLSGKDLGEPQEGQGEGQQGQGQQSGQQSGGMMSKIKKALGGVKSSSKEKQKGQGGQGEGSEDLKNEINNKAGSDLKEKVSQELGEQEKQLKKTDEELENQGQKTGTLPEDIDLSKLPPDLLKELEELARKLSPEQQQQLEKAARENLDKKQAEALKKEGPKHLQAEKDEKTGEYEVKPRRAPSQKEIEKLRKEIEEFNQEQEQQAAQQSAQQDQSDQEEQQRKAERLTQEMEKQDMLKNGFEEHEKELYKIFKQLEGSMQQRIANFLKIMDRYLPKKETYEYGGEYYSGVKMNKRSVTKRAPIKDYRIFERREVIESTEPRMFVELLIDNSGSMRGPKMEESLKTAIFWSRVLRILEIPFAVKFFGDRVLDIMKFDDDYDDPKKKIKPKLVQSADASGGSTDMGSPLIKANEEMTTSKRRFVGSFGGVFVISDSGANAGLTGEALKGYIEAMQKNFIVMNFILSQSQAEIEEAKRYFGEKNVVAPAKFEDLPDESFKVLRVTLERILKIYKPQS